MNKYFFTISLHLKKDVSQNYLESLIKLKATHFIPLNVSKTDKKFVHFYYKTKEYSNIYSDDEFELYDAPYTASNSFISSSDI